MEQKQKVGSFVASLLIVVLLIAFLAIPNSYASWHGSHFSPKGATSVVTNPNNDGPGTLRQALLDAQVGDTITFDAAIFPPQTAVTITLQSELPMIMTNSLTIDGSHAGVVLDGAQLSGEENGLTIQGAVSVTIRGLQIMHFPANGIVIQAGASDNTIGGTQSTDRNIISGNAQAGLLLKATANNQVIGNFIGTNSDGTLAMANGKEGIRVDFGTVDNVIGAASAGNLISGNGGDGINIRGSTSTGNRVIGNYIGTDVTGTRPLGNQKDGIFFFARASQNTVGGTTALERNIISGNQENGIVISGNTTHNQIIGNYIGTDVTGGVALGNNEDGISLSTGCQNNIVGGESEGAGNVISGNNHDGIVIDGNGTANNQILANYIGTDATGEIPLGNGGTGIEVGSGSSNNLIGGNNPQARNVISGNRSWGIGIGGSGNQFLGNYVGTDATGINPVPNNIGMEIGDPLASGNVVSGTLIAFNGSVGIIAQKGAANLFEGNIVTQNGGIAAKVNLTNDVINNDFSDNEFNYMEVVTTFAPLDRDYTLTRQGDLNTYLFSVSSLMVASSGTLTVTPGVEMVFDSSLQTLEVEGTLVAVGNADEPIRFTAPEGLANRLFGEWGGLTFSKGSLGVLHHTTIEFAQNGVTIEGGEVEVISSTIAASQSNGIVVEGGTLILENNNFAQNGELAIQNLTGKTIEATGSWWGSADGPRNIGGHGDPVSENVNVQNWREEPGRKDRWQSAPILNLGTHHFRLNHHRDIHWFRFPMPRSAMLTVTLSHAQKDYDFFQFSGLEEPSWIDDIGDSHGEAQDTANAKNIGSCSSRYIRQVASLGRANTARLLPPTCEEDKDEKMVWHVREESGWYYLLVIGHNGASDATVPYTLQITSTATTSGQESDFDPPRFDPPESRQPGIKTLILTNRARLEERHGLEQTEALMVKLDELASHSQVAGEVIDLDTEPDEQIREAYEAWDKHQDDPLYANYVATSIKILLTSMRGAYPDLENILLVGNDDIVPFRRIPDEVPLANERSYAIEGESALAASLREAYFLSDDYYVAFHPTPYRGRALNLPEYGVGRLVETPAEMLTAIDTFLQNPVLTVNSSLVTGYDFLTDQAQAIQEELQAGGLAVTPLIDDFWQANDLREGWMIDTHDFKSINAHFDHWQAIPAARSSENVTAKQVQASDNLAGTVVFSVGCHSGLPVPGSDGNQLDFAQVLVGEGATYLANTGYGYGDANAIGYSEHLMWLFTHHLREGTTNGQTMSLGDALRQAKQEYFNTLGLDSLSFYDEKVLSVATLYGFPMYQIEIPGNPVEVTPSSKATRTAQPSSPTPDLAPATPCAEGLTCREARFTPIYITQTITDGTYSSIEGQTQEVPGKPIHPRTTSTILQTSITNTLEITVAHGALFEGGHYESFSNFNPVITRIITESTDHNAGEPGYFEQTWYPAEWSFVNSVRTNDQFTQQLVVIPAQYRATNGVMRRFSDMSYTVYYSGSDDTIPPRIWQVNTLSETESSLVQVEVTDFFDVVRVVATYTVGDGEWKSVNLTQTDNPDIWEGTLPQHSELEYFVQAVDSSGNVAIDNNKGRYFPSAPTPTSTDIYLPLVTR